MALTRKYLSTLGIEADKIDQIIEAHTETVDALKKERDGYKADAEKLPDVQKELDSLKAGGDYKARYEKEHKDFEDYKASVTAKETRTAKEAAVRAYYTGKGITGNNLEIAMRGSAAEIDAAELDGDKIKDFKAFDELIGGTFKGLVGKTETRGTNTATPPANNGGGGTMTKAEIMAIKDTAQRQAAILANHELFGI